MNILGIGALSARGRGVGALRKALHEGWREPSKVNIRHSTLPAYLVDLERIEDRSLLKKLRRSDKLSKMAVLAASDAVADSGIGEEERKKIGVIVATAFGAHATTFEFLDGIIDFGEAAVSPTSFSNSVHNAAASYVSSSLGIQGPTLTVTQFFFSFQAAIQLAAAWLHEGRVKHVLVGGVDQFGEVMGYASGEKLKVASDGRIRPLQGTSLAVPGEGAAFFLLGREGTERAYCSVEKVLTGANGKPSFDAGLTIIDADGLLPDESCYRSLSGQGKLVVAYSPLWGSMMTGSAFSIAAGAIMLKDDVIFPAPYAEKTAAADQSSVEFIRCIRYNCSGAGAEASLRAARKGR